MKTLMVVLAVLVGGCSSLQSNPCGTPDLPSYRDCAIDMYVFEDRNLLGFDKKIPAQVSTPIGRKPVEALEPIDAKTLS